MEYQKAKMTTFALTAGSYSCAAPKHLDAFALALTLYVNGRILVFGIETNG